MTVKELKEEMSYFDEDAEIVFEVCDDFEPESVTEDRWGNRSVRINSKLRIVFSSEQNGNWDIEFVRDEP